MLVNESDFLCGLHNFVDLRQEQTNHTALFRHKKTLILSASYQAVHQQSLTLKLPAKQIGQKVEKTALFFVMLCRKHSKTQKKKSCQNPLGMTSSKPKMS